MPENSKISDQRLLEAIARSDSEALAELYLRYAGRVRTFAFALLQDVDEADDIVHEIFLSIWEKRDKATMIHDVDTYLYGMTRNAVASRIKDRDREMQYRHNYNIERPADDDPDATHEALTSDARLLEAIESLPEPQRSILIMAKMQGKSYREIAGQYNISVHTVHYHIKKALKLLRQTLATLLLFSL